MVIVILLQSLDLSLMQVEKLFSEILCEKKTSPETTAGQQHKMKSKGFMIIVTFTSMIRSKRLLLNLAIEAFLPVNRNLTSDGHSETFYAVHFHHLEMLELSLQLCTEWTLLECFISILEETILWKISYCFNVSLF